MRYTPRTRYRSFGRYDKAFIIIYPFVIPTECNEWSVSHLSYRPSATSGAYPFRHTDRVQRVESIPFAIPTECNEWSVSLSPYRPSSSTHLSYRPSATSGEYPTCHTDRVKANCGFCNKVACRHGLPSPNKHKKKRAKCPLNWQGW